MYFVFVALAKTTPKASPSSASPSPGSKKPITSRVGSMDNAKHVPGGGKVSH